MSFLIVISAVADPDLTTLTVIVLAALFLPEASVI